VGRPLTTPQPPGAVRFGVRRMALAGTVEEVPDAPATATAFGRLQAARGCRAGPQGHGVSLVEGGAHPMMDAGLWPDHGSERGGRVAPPSLGPTG
jgi:hypothetical protein